MRMQAELARRTRNVTVVLDCGFSVQMSRDVAVRDANARALRPVHGVDAHLATLRTRYGMAFTDELVENVEAVVLCACSEAESAYEYPDADGAYRGAFTEALCDALDAAADARISWRAVMDHVRSRVLGRFFTQRPSLEGPIDRRPFSVVEPRGACRRRAARAGRGSGASSWFLVIVATSRALLDGSNDDRRQGEVRVALPMLERTHKAKL